MIQNSRLVELAIKGLEAEKARIEQELMELRNQRNTTNSDKRSTSSGTTGTAAAGTRAGR